MSYVKRFVEYVMCLFVYRHITCIGKNTKFKVNLVDRGYSRIDLIVYTIDNGEYKLKVSNVRTKHAVRIIRYFLSIEDIVMSDICLSYHGLKGVKDGDYKEDTE
jgi:hypothetical protein